MPFRDRSYWQGVLALARRPQRWDRLQAFVDGYGIGLDEGLVDAVLASQRAGLDRISRLVELGHPRYRRLVDDGVLEREERAARWGQRLRRRFDLPGQDLVVTPP